MAPPLRRAPGLLSVKTFMRAENLSASASRRVGRGAGGPRQHVVLDQQKVVV